MTTILVTGATGTVGRKTLQHLLKRKPAGELVGLARDPEKAADLAAAGIEIRQGDYADHVGLVQAFTGIGTVMLVSATAFTDRNAHHANAIEAAREAGVRRVVFMPVIHKDGSDVLPQITREDRFAEEALRASGLAWTIVRHPPFLDTIESYIGGKALETGVHLPAGAGKAGFASRDDLAEAHAVVLTEPGHEDTSYSLHGDPAVSFADVAGILSDIGGKPVPFVACSEQDYVDRLLAAGLPAPAAEFVLEWVRGINAGEWDGEAGDLETLLGRKPTTATEFLRAHYSNSRA